MRNSKYNFVPFRVEKGKIKGESPYVKLRKPGSLVFPKSTLLMIGVDLSKDHFGAILYLDKEKRTMAFKISSIVLSPEHGFRTITINKAKKGGFKEGIIMVGSLLRHLPDICFGKDPLYLEEYEDKDMLLNIGKVWTFTIPKQIKS